MITKEKVLKAPFLPSRFQRHSVKYCLAFVILCIMCYIYVQTDSLQKNPKDSSWNYSDFLADTFRKMEGVVLQNRSERKLVLLWTDYFKLSDWLPSTTKLKCPVQECDVTSNRSLLSKSSAVIMHWRNINPEDLPPECTQSESCPVLVLFNKEAPPHTTSDKVRKLNSRIHLVASYRKDSEIYAPYGKIVKRTGAYKTPELKKNRKAVCWLVSHCNTNSNREVYVNNLRRYIDVDVYGKCGNLTCPHEDTRACYKWLSERYKFYLSFENSICKDYSTEKLYYTMMEEMVPIVMGGDDYARYLPSHSFIDVADYGDPSMLGRYLKELDKDDKKYLEYFRWKKHFAAEFVPYEWFCDVCALLHSANVQDLKPHKNLISWWYGGANCGSL